MSTSQYIKILILTLASLLATSVFAGSNRPVTGTVTVMSPYNFNTTKNRIVSSAKSHGLLVKDTINHQEIASGIGKKILPVTAILVGKPTFDFALISHNPQGALFIPITIAVWNNKAGKTYVSYLNPVTNIAPLLHVKKSSELMQNLKSMRNTISKTVYTAIKK